MTTAAVRLSYAIAVAFFSILAVSLAGVAYTNHVQKQAEQRAELVRAESERRAEMVRIESDRRWCQLLGDLDAAYNDPPPATATGRSVAAEVHRLRTEPQPAGFGCPAP